MALSAGYWTGSATSHALERKALVDYGVKEFTDIPEYQGVGAGQLMYAGLASLVVFSIVAWSAWRLTARISLPKARSDNPGSGDVA
jgi:hypothetical protein